MGVEIGEAVERVNGKELRYSEFVERYLKGNRPVVLTGLMDGWRACGDWVTKDGRPNLSFFSADPFAKSIVQVADCDKREFTDQKRMEMSVSEFIKHWLGLPAEKCGGDLDCNNVTHSLLYLKDWHFNKEHPGYMAYTTPAFFSDDWLNIYLDSHHAHQDSDMHLNRKEVNCADYRFVYMGEKGTWTPLHADVFRSYSWSANVCGKKYWLLLPPSQCHLAFDRNLKTSVYDVYGEVSEARFPGFKKTVWWECTQEHNEIIFVPSGWYHQVHNLEEQHCCEVTERCLVALPAAEGNHRCRTGLYICEVSFEDHRIYRFPRDPGLKIANIRSICGSFTLKCCMPLAFGIPHFFLLQIKLANFKNGL